MTGRQLLLRFFVAILVIATAPLSNALADPVTLQVLYSGAEPEKRSAKPDDCLIQEAQARCSSGYHDCITYSCGCNGHCCCPDGYPYLSHCDCNCYDSSPDCSSYTRCSIPAN